MFVYKQFYYTKFVLFFYESPKEIKDIKTTETRQLGMSITIPFLSFSDLIVWGFSKRRLENKTSFSLNLRMCCIVTARKGIIFYFSDIISLELTISAISLGKSVNTTLYSCSKTFFLPRK